MTKRKPACTTFIVAALRKMRQNPSNLKPDGTSGVALCRLWPVASALYSEAEFRSAVNELIASQTLTLAVVTLDRLSGRKHQLWTELPDAANLSERRWYRDNVGRQILKSEWDDRRHECVFSMHLYVTADGLPVWVKKIRRPGTLLEQILAAVPPDTTS